MLVAVVLSPGVVVNESRALRSVLGALPGGEVIGVGEVVGPVAGAGGVERVERALGTITCPAIIAIPGAIGVQHHATDSELLAWLRAAAAGADWVVASSTGSVVLAAAGLLDGLAATTHWLATDLLSAQGAEVSDRRVVRSGKFITCQGAVSAIEVGLALAETIGGRELVAEVRGKLLAAPPSAPRRSWRRRTRAAAPAVTVIDLRR